MCTDNLRVAIVFGWGAVERCATKWEPLFTSIEEIQPCLWLVFVEARAIGVIAKDPWTKEGALASALAFLRN